MMITEQMQKVKELGMSTLEKQRNINTSEVFHLWNHLIQRYHVIFITESLEMFTNDKDLKAVINLGKDTLAKHAATLEKEMLEYGIPLPVRPPKQTQITIDFEQITDRYVFRRILRGIQSFLPTHLIAFIHSTSPKIREQFLSFLVDEMKLYDKFLEYGKIKGYIVIPPLYRP